MARQRVTSLDNPERSLSRQELAELINSWVWERYGKKVEASSNYIGQLERGTIRWPGKLYREALRSILGVSKDSDLGLINARSLHGSVKLGNMKRRQLPSAIIGVGAALGEVVELLEVRKTTPIPRRIGAGDIEQVRAATQAFDSLSRAYGGGASREAVIGQLRYSTGLLEATCPDRLRPELFSAVADLGEVAGYMALDADAHDDARRIFGIALSCAEEAKDWNLRARVLSSMTQQAVWIGQPDEGLTLTEQALVRADWLTPGRRALLHTDRAFALAKMRRVQETLSAIGTADEHFAHVIPANEPFFVANYTNALQALYTGRPLVDLAILGRNPREATTRLEGAAAEFPPGSVRARGVCLAKLASLLMATGDPLQAAGIGHQALDVASMIRSHRAAEELRELYRYAAPRQHLQEVAHLRHRIATALMRTDNP